MTSTALDLSALALKKYRPLDAIRRRKIATNADLSRRRRRAMFAARKVAKILYNEFGAREVILFGSLARHGGFTLFSDIDIAALGIPPKRFFEAVGIAIGMSAEFKIDLIDLKTCSSSMRENIKKDGKTL